MAYHEIPHPCLIRQTLSAAAGIILLLASCTAVGTEAAVLTAPGDLPVSVEPVHLTGFIPSAGFIRDIRTNAAMLHVSERTNIHVDWIESQKLDAHEQLSLLLSGDSYPGIIQGASGSGLSMERIVSYGADDYVGRGALLPLDDYVGTAINTDVIDDSALQSGTINGRLYGISTGVNMPALAYNRGLLEREGIPLPATSMSYDDFREYLVMLRDNLPSGVYPMMDIGVMSSNTTPFGYWTRYNGTPMYDAELNTTHVTPEAATEYLAMFQDYRENGLIPPADIAAGYAESNADSSSLVAGRVAIGYLFTNQLPGYQAAMTDELDLIEFPGAAETNALWVAPSQFYTVNRNSQNIEQTIRFIDFLVNDPDAALILGNDRGASASATARAAGAATPADQKVLNYLDAAAPHTSPETPHVPNDTELNNTAYLIYQQVAFGQLTPEQGGREIHDLLMRLIERQ